MTAPTAAVSPWAPLWTLIEKAGWQAAEAFLAVFILAGTFDTSIGTKAGIAGMAALFTGLANAAQTYAIPAGLPPLVDVVVRAVRSFLAAFLAPVAAVWLGGTIPGLDGWKSAAFAGVLAATAVVKGFVVSKIPVGTDTAATLPARFDLAA